MLLECSDYIVAKIWDFFSTANLPNFANFKIMKYTKSYISQYQKEKTLCW